jgi:TolB protein
MGGVRRSSLVVVALIALLLTATLVLLLGASAAHAAFPGANGKIAFVSGGHAWTIDPDGSGETALPPPARGPLAGYLQWSPDGSRLVDSVQGACYDYCSYFMYTFAGNGMDPQAVPGASDVNLSPSWSNDGRQLAYAAETYYGMELWATTIDGSNNRRLAVPYYGVQDTAWSPDGTAIAYTSGGYLRCYGFDSVRPCAFVNTPALGPLSRSPDGSRIAFTRQQPGNAGRDIYVLNRLTGIVEQLTTDPAWDGEPAWSPDGTKIAFVSPATTRTGARPFT